MPSRARALAPAPSRHCFRAGPITPYIDGCSMAWQSHLDHEHRCLLRRKARHWRRQRKGLPAHLYPVCQSRFCAGGLGRGCQPACKRSARPGMWTTGWAGCSKAGKARSCASAAASRIPPLPTLHSYPLVSLQASKRGRWQSRLAPEPRLACSGHLLAACSHGHGGREDRRLHPALLRGGTRPPADAGLQRSRDAVCSRGRRMHAGLMPAGQPQAARRRRAAAAGSGGTGRRPCAARALTATHPLLPPPCAAHHLDRGLLHGGGL